MARPIPEGTPSIVPHLVVRDGAAAIEFYKAAFGAHELVRMVGPDGTGVMHAELRIGDARLYLADEWPGSAVGSPATLGGTSFNVHLWFEDVDAAWARAVAAGATPVMPLDDAFWGDRYGMLKDPEGHVFSVSTHKEDLTPEEIGRRAAEFFAQMPPPPPPEPAQPRPKAARRKATRRKATRTRAAKRARSAGRKRAAAAPAGSKTSPSGSGDSHKSHKSKKSKKDKGKGKGKGKKKDKSKKKSKKGKKGR